MQGWLDGCPQRADEHSIASGCKFHEGYIDILPPSEPFDAATSNPRFSVHRRPRRSLRLLPSDYSVPPPGRKSCEFWRPASALLMKASLTCVRKMGNAEVPAERIEHMRVTYARDVAVLPTDAVGAIVSSGGFESPIQFFQAGLIHAWYAKRTSKVADK